MLLVIILFIIKLGLCIFNKKIKPLKNLDKNIAKQKSCLYKNIEKKDKLQRKLETLKKAYSSGYISKDSYLKGVRRIKRLLNK
jgi:predicted Holliday junction resolvase-like endonuclease